MRLEEGKVEAGLGYVARCCLKIATKTKVKNKAGRQAPDHAVTEGWPLGILGQMVNNSFKQK